MTPTRGYEVRIKSSAEHEMNSLQRATFQRVTKAILSLEGSPRRRGAKKLRGRKAYRLRVGDYRIVYTVDDASRTVEVTAVRHRKDVYRGDRA
ncbi:MAG: type II toxin-antitoxin system RelE/ParE family toxin [Planctomycetota bacterium]